MAEKWKRPQQIMSIRGKRLDDYPEFDDNTHSIDAFYNRNIRLWTIQLLNKERLQIGEAEYEPNREFAIKRIKLLLKQHKVSVVTGIKIK